MDSNQQEHNKKSENIQQMYGSWAKIKISSDRTQNNIYHWPEEGSAMSLTDESKLDIRNPLNKQQRSN